MTRSNIVKGLMENINETDIIIASTGYISREVYKQNDRALNFYMMGSMGNALAIGIGVAMNVRSRVFVINGDGSVLMSLGTMLTAKRLNLSNLVHCIIDNNCHESTGGQPTVSNLVDFRHLSKNVILYKCRQDNTVPPRIKLSPQFIAERFSNAVQSLCKQK